MSRQYASPLIRSRRVRAAATSMMLAASLATSGCAGVGTTAVSALPNAMESTGPAANPGQPIATAQPGDSNLSCPALTAEMAQMDQIAAEKVDTGVSAVSFIPVVGSLVSLASINSHANALQDQANLKNQAYQRKQYLLQLFAQKGC